MRNTRLFCAASRNSPNFLMDYNPLAAEVSKEHASWDESSLRGYGKIGSRWNEMQCESHRKFEQRHVLLVQGYPDVKVE